MKPKFIIQAIDEGLIVIADQRGVGYAVSGDTITHQIIFQDSLENWNLIKNDDIVSSLHEKPNTEKEVVIEGVGPCVIAEIQEKVSLADVIAANRLFNKMYDEGADMSEIMSQTKEKFVERINDAFVNIAPDVLAGMEEYRRVMDAAISGDLPIHNIKPMTPADRGKQNSKDSGRRIDKGSEP